jgi:zinc D-Ala-D-Ala carboxypeptidase
VEEMKLTENFTKEEMTLSDTAIRLGIDNNPNIEQFKNLFTLCTYVLEPLRGIVGPIKINSGFRSKEVNEKIGGAQNSQHCKGQAADTIAVDLSVKDYFKTIQELVRAGEIQIDQCIIEFDKWVHISYKSKDNRNEFLIASKIDGKTVYSKATP